MKVKAKPLTAGDCDLQMINCLFDAAYIKDEFVRLQRVQMCVLSYTACAAAVTNAPDANRIRKLRNQISKLEKAKQKASKKTSKKASKKASK